MSQAAVPRVHLSLGRRLSALAVLFGLSLRQHVRGRRLLVLAVLYLLPIGIAVFARAQNAPPDELEFALLFNMIPHALAPVTALLYASGMIQDEVEEQTLTYLLIRCLPKWALYLTKLLATLFTTVLLTTVFTAITCAVIHWGAPDLWGPVLPWRTLRICALLALSLAAYCSVFGFISLYARRSLVAGVVYIVLFEGVLANIDFAVRRLTVMYYFRVLSARWLELPARLIAGWSLDLSDAPAAKSCVRVLLAVSFVAGIFAAWTFAVREFRMKTPEGS